MALSSELTSKFVKVTKDTKKRNTESTVYGTTVNLNGSLYVKFDGSDLLTPVSTTTDMETGERVAVLVKSHTATVMGNISSPSPRRAAVQALNEKVEAAEGYIIDLEAENVKINETLTANSASIKSLEANNVTINNKLTAAEADIETLETSKLDADTASITYATIESLQATNASINDLEARKLDAEFAEMNYATVSNLEAVNASIEDLDVKKLDAESADILYANIDFANIGQAAFEKIFSGSGIIKDLVFDEGTITGELVGVTIKGDLIEGNTVVADKLVIKGEDGLYYKLNTDGVTTEAEQTEYNSLNGSVITAKSITATKISVDDLVAFDATIGGFNITDSAIYSGVKESATNTTRGVYFDKEGQLSVGDSNNYLRYFKDADGTYKLEISSESLETRFSNVEISVKTAQENIDNLEIGGRNLLLNSESQRGGTRFFSIDTYDILADYVGRTITISFDAIILEGGTSRAIMMYGYQGNGISIPKELLFTPTSEWQRFSFVTTVKDFGIKDESYTKGSIGFYDTVGDNKCAIRRIKIELGNKATDWTRAPEDFETRVTTAESNITQLSNKITANVAETSSLGTRMTIVEQTATDLTTRIADDESDIEDAAKTATNFLNFSTNGLVVGDMTADTLSKNVRIGSDAVEVRTGETVNAVFGGDIIELAKDNEAATISMLNDEFKIYYDADNSDGGFGVYGKTSNGVEILAFQPINQNGNLTLGWGGYAAKTNATHIYGNNVKLISNAEMNLVPGDGYVRLRGNVTIPNGNNLYGTNTSGDLRSMVLWNSSDQLQFGYGSYKNAEGSVYYDGNTVNIRSNNGIYIDGRKYGQNKLLWSGAWYMTASQTATLSEAVSSQPNGIVLVWSYYPDGAVSDSHFQFTFIPKHYVSVMSGKGVTIFLAHGTLAHAAGKYVYISDTTIVGNDNNNTTATAKASGITASPNLFVLRYVIGV